MTKCFTFYSYKGGSGRSTTAVNTVRHLIDTMKASPEHPILLVDADLESAGLTYFFECENKFTALFEDTIHASKLLSPSDRNQFLRLRTPSDNELRKVPLVQQIFDSPDITTAPVLDHRGIVNGLLEYYNEQGINYGKSDIEFALKGVCLLNGERETLHMIVNAFIEKKPENSDQKIRIHYKLLDLIPDLKEIEESTKNDEEKQLEKHRMIRNFLPAHGFWDISKHFNAKPGTVKFLGTDLSYEAPQVIRGADVTAPFNHLCRVCNIYNYAAIVYDSGAGVQSSADALQKSSHVLVYCMRPTRQFRKGTVKQLSNYKDALTEAMEFNKEDGFVSEKSKIVILLPTAVPMQDTHRQWREDAFQEIRGSIVRAFSEIVDGSFCEKEDSALNEVERFKWSEKIFLSEEEVQNNPDEKHAYQVYRKLAEKLTEFSEGSSQ